MKMSSGDAVSFACDGECQGTQELALYVFV